MTIMIFTYGMKVSFKNNPKPFSALIFFGAINSLVIKKYTTFHFL